MLKRTFSMTMMVILMVSVLAACGGGNNAEGNANTGGAKTEISVLVGKQEISKQFEEMVKEYNGSQDKVKVSLIPTAGQNGYERITTLYASNNAPNIMHFLSEFGVMKDKLADLSDQEWVKNANSGTLDYVTEDGKVYGMPMSIEAFGFLYNKSVLDKAVGGSFDPATIKTQDDLKALFDKIKASGVSAFHISPVDWSLGAHFTNVFMANEAPDHADRVKYLEDLKSGSVDLAADKVFNGWLDTFDLMKEYNSAKDSPLAAQYDDAPILLADGEVGMWFMGNWAYTQIKEIDPDGEYGFLPVPVSNNAEDFGNSKISVGVPEYWTVDASQSTPEEQQASKDFLNWMVSSEKGQDYYVNQFGFLPAYSNFTTKPSDPVSQSVLSYTDAEQTLEWMNSYYPPEAFPAMAASMQKYLAGETDRAGLTKEIQAYWNQAK
ncbi:ABC transporter substrate-binding protein [Paenibacillus donghaensis]|uniref:ABC transporter substrate-binding protein n=1 Tax=Paenibacillus donghaensis TaxID=414771 RepID=A0A2Z2KEB2_9BACL|nr:ABC transporter substrate-binding protein [Paenibacillus donghaensis]ASA24047.1 ABC transporter substrate-binding protein [Paenibacillus donghaensis]